MKKYFLPLILLIFCMTTASYADFYTWQDEDGTTHITDYPPPHGKKSQDVKIYKSDDAATADDKAASEDEKAKVIIFTKNDCPDCDKAKDYLNSKNVKFTEYNMDTDDNAEAKRKEFDQYTDVPFAVINRSQVYGFSESIYERALKAAP